MAAGEPQNTPDVPGITNLVNQELAKSDCIKFAEAILNQLSGGKGGSLADTFKAFLNQPKSHALFTRTAPAGSWGESSPIGNIKNSTAAIFLRAGDNQTLRDAANTISELFHLSRKDGLYTDKALANALHRTSYAADANSLIGPRANIFHPDYVPGDWTEENQKGYSVYFHSIQRKYCGGLLPPTMYK